MTPKLPRLTVLRVTLGTIEGIIGGTVGDMTRGMIGSASVPFTQQSQYALYGANGFRLHPMALPSAKTSADLVAKQQCPLTLMPGSEADQRERKGKKDSTA